MTRSLLGTGIALDHPVNYEAFIDLHRAVQPTTVLGMVDAAKDMAKIKQLQRDLPGVQIIGRVWHDLEGAYAMKPTGPGDTRVMIATPSDILQQQGELGHDGTWLHVMNEPSAFLSAEEVGKTVDWLVTFIRMAAVDKCACVLANLADGHPPIVNGLWPTIWYPFLKEMARYPDLMKLGLHFYGKDKVSAVITALNATCKELGIKPPQVVGTEYGVDSTGQGDKANGYHNLKWSGEQFLDWERDTLQGELKPFAASGQLVGLDTFEWNENWGAFSIAKDGGYQAAYKKAAEAGELDVQVETVSTPVPVVIQTPTPAPAANPPLPSEDVPASNPPAAPPPMPEVKLWDIGLKFRGTEPQKEIFLRGVEQMIFACALIGQAAGADIEAVAQEVIAV